jgi:predicted PurR-regulated permease PerM
MNISGKQCFRIGSAIFLLYLCITYWGVVAQFLFRFAGALSPVAIGFAIAYVLNLLMGFYERHYFTKQSHKKAVEVSRRPVCMIAAILTLCGILALVIGLVVPELISCISFLLSEIPPALQKLFSQPWVVRLLPEDLSATLASIDWMTVLTKVWDFIRGGFSNALTTVMSAVISVFSGIVTAFLSVIFAIYMLASKEKLIRQTGKVMNRFFNRKTVLTVTHVGRVLNRSFKRFIVGQCTEAVILGVLCVVGMWIFRFPYATMVGALIGITALIPVAGAYIGAGVGALMILTVSPVKALFFLVFIVVLQQLEGNLIYPKVVGDSIGLPALFVLAAITVGGSLGGVLGMLVAVPLTATVYYLLKETVNRTQSHDLKKTKKG